MEGAEMANGAMKTSKKSQVFFQDEYAVIGLDSSVPCVELTLNGVPRHSEHYRQVQLKRLELIKSESKNFPRIHLLTDSRHAGTVLDEDVALYKEVVLPEFKRAGIKYLAIVMPQSKYAQLTIRELTADLAFLNVHYFNNEREAKAWLRKMPAV